MARQKAEDVWQRGGIPIFVGGTGFYLRVLQEGISPMPETDMQILNSLQARLDQEGHEVLYKELERIDSDWVAQTSPEDSHRILRGLSIFQQTGKALTEWQQESRVGGLDAAFTKLAISPERETLNDRIHRRYLKMIEEGVLEEARDLYDKYLKNLPNHEVPPPAFKSIGVMDFADSFEERFQQKKLTIGLNSKCANMLSDSALGCAIHTVLMPSLRRGRTLTPS